MDAAEYYKLRLEHTLQHTQQATRLIYLVDAGIVAMIYVVIDRFSGWPSQRFLALGLFGLLCFVNAIHARLIMRQSKWYGKIDSALAKAVGAERVEIGSGMGTHRLYAVLHWTLAVAALIAGGVYFLVSR